MLVSFVKLQKFENYVVFGGFIGFYFGTLWLCSRLSRFADKFFSVIIIFKTDVGMLMIMVHNGCFVFDGSEAPPEFDEEFNLCFDTFEYVGIYVWKVNKVI
jgi:hypothetical protein